MDNTQEFEKESLLQELHSLRLKNSQLQKMYDETFERVVVMETEINVAVTKCEDHETNSEQAMRSKQKLEEELETWKELVETVETKCLSLEEQLEEAKKSQDTTQTSSCDCHTTIFALKTKIEALEKENEYLKNENLEVGKSQIELLSNYQSTASQLEDMISMYEGKRDELESAKQMVEGLNEDKVLLEAELNLLKVPNRNLDQRGNSLFAEVEDKRKSIAKNLEVMKLKYDKLNQKYTQAQQEINKLKDENIQLLSEASNERVRQIEEKMMEGYRTRIADLEKLVAVYSKRPESPIIKTVDFPDLDMVSKMLNRARSEAESWRVEFLRKSQAESEHDTKAYMAERQLRLSEASNQAKQKEIETLKTRLNELEETKKAFIKLKEDLESESKENSNPVKKPTTKFVRFCPDLKNRMEEEINKPKMVKQPKCANVPLIFIKSENPGVPVIQVSSELKKKNKDALKKAE